MPDLTEKRIQPRRDDHGLAFAIYYFDADELLRDCRQLLSDQPLHLPLQGVGAAGAAVTLRCTFPGLRAPLVISVELAEVVGRRHRDGAGLLVTLDAPGRAALAALVPRLEAADAELLIETVRVLLVEDNTYTATFIEDGLHLAMQRMFQGRLGFHIPIATTAADASAFLSGDKPIDALIADIYLAGSHGAALLEQVRANPKRAEIPIIATAGGSDEGVRRAAVAAGATALLQKPLSMRDLMSALCDALNLTR
ncbi:MAG: hypothetical protein Tsb0020_33320 [Haliangiales bacterium]